MASSRGVHRTIRTARLERPVASATDATAKDPTTGRTLVAAGAVVIDVRTPEEYSAGHLPAAANIPVQELAARLDDVTKLVADDKSRPIVVYCKAGGRAAKAVTQLAAAGYTRVINGGGLDDLR